jgi:hypothetical protein
VTGQELLLTLLVMSAPVTLALIVAMLRGYTIHVHLARKEKRRERRRPDE